MGPSLEAINLMVSLSAEYRPIFDFILLLSALLGFLFGLWVLNSLVGVYVTGTIPKDQFNWGLALFALILSGSMMTFTTMMMLMTNSLLDAGAGSIFPPDQIAAELTPDKMLGMFAENTLRVLAAIFGLWGLIEMFLSRMPSGDRQKIWSGFVRFCVGAILMNARLAGNFFGGMGDVVFG